MKKIISMAILLLCATTLQAKYRMPDLADLLKDADAIADVTIKKFDKQGAAIIQVHENIKGNAPDKIDGIRLSCTGASAKASGMEVGKRYLVILKEGDLYEGRTYFPIQFTIRCGTGVKEGGAAASAGFKQCQFYRSAEQYGTKEWQAFDDVKKMILAAQD